MTSRTTRLAQKAKAIAAEDAKEAETIVLDVLKSKSYLYPLKGIYYFLRYPDLSKPLRAKLTPVLGTAMSVTTAMFTFAYLPQAAILSIFNGPLAVISTILLVLSESATITHVLSRGLFIDDAMIDTFDGVSSYALRGKALPNLDRLSSIATKVI